VNVEMPEVLPDLSPSFEITLYRVLQEAIHNIAKHSQATEAALQLRYHRSRLFVILKDNGVGFDPKQAFDSHGLAGIRERLRELRGSLSIESSPQGTKLRLNVQVRKNERKAHKISDRR
jgi:two-component system, NarL family, sensor histidine kinase NreB